MAVDLIVRRGGRLTTEQRVGYETNQIANGRERFGDRAYSELISTMPGLLRFAPWIEVEAKHKEPAIVKLPAEWLPNADL